jgi:hypothetical protein
VQHRARDTHKYGVKRITETHRRDNNNVYAAVLRAAQSDPNSTLWYPRHLAADSLGRAFVGLDEALRSTNQSQPAIVIESERNNGWANVFIGRTKRRGGLEPTTAPVRKDYSHTTIFQSRDALAIPVNNRHTDVFQINPGSFGRDTNLGSYRRTPSQYSTIKDGFKLVLPQGGNFSEVAMDGSYDVDGETVEFSGQLGWEGSAKVTVAVGNLSVTNALDALQAGFAEESRRPTQQALLFSQLAKRVLGKSQVRLTPVVNA